MEKEIIKRIIEDAKEIKKKNLSLNQKAKITDFETQKNASLISRFLKGIEKINKYTNKSLSPHDQNLIKELEEIIITKESLKPTIKFKIPEQISNDIRPDLILDAEEIEKCFEAKAYRSVIILCGRIIEVILHRKYFETTGQDILDKNPGIGLGKLIAKLLEKNVSLDPALTQQIHLINQVRIFSVHKKKEPFYPSKEQAQAIILYTSDAIKKIF